MKSGFERTPWIEHSRLQDTIATGYLSRNIDLTFVVLFYLCVPVVIFCTLISLSVSKVL